MGLNFNFGRRESSQLQDQIANRSNDSSSFGVPFNIRLPFEKPPTYDESQRRMMEAMGFPPPEYPEVPRTSTNCQECAISNSSREITEVTIASSSSMDTLTPVLASTSSDTARSDTVRSGKPVDSTTTNKIGVSNCSFEPD